LKALRSWNIGNSASLTSPPWLLSTSSLKANAAPVLGAFEFLVLTEALVLLNPLDEDAEV
jgi:hypothetical protein